MHFYLYLIIYHLEYRLNNRTHDDQKNVGDAGLEQNPTVNAQFGRSVLQDQPDQAYIESGAEHQRGQGTDILDLADHRSLFWVIIQ